MVYAIVLNQMRETGNLKNRELLAVKRPVYILSVSLAFFIFIKKACLVKNLFDARLYKRKLAFFKISIARFILSGFFCAFIGCLAAILALVIIIGIRI